MSLEWLYAPRARTVPTAFPASLATSRVLELRTLDVRYNEPPSKSKAVQQTIRARLDKLRRRRLLLFPLRCNLRLVFVVLLLFQVIECLPSLQCLVRHWAAFHHLLYPTFGNELPDPD